MNTLAMFLSLALINKMEFLGTSYGDFGVKAINYGDTSVVDFV